MMIFGDYAIDQDSNNYIVQKRTVHGAKSKTPGVEYWKDISYYGINQIELALQNVLMRKIHAAHKDELRHVIKVLCDTKAEIMEAVKCLKK